MRGFKLLFLLLNLSVIIDMAKDFQPTSYVLQSVKSGNTFNDEGWTLDAPTETAPTLIRAIYNKKQLFYVRKKYFSNAFEILLLFFYYFFFKNCSKFLPFLVCSLFMFTHCQQQPHVDTPVTYSILDQVDTDSAVEMA